jgi:hypothetical protein
VTLPLVLLQAIAADRLPDVVTPLVDAVYGPTATGDRHDGLQADVVADTLVERP